MAEQVQTQTEKKPPLVIIAGPTAVGKTDISVRLAKKIGGEIISADSIQVYKGLDIGSAKVTADEMQGVPHHLIDVIEPEVQYDAAAFQQMAQEAIQTVYSHGHIPILTGGTGFYIQALLYVIDFSGEADAEKQPVRARLEAQAQTAEGRAQLWEQLCQCDPDASREIHPNNVKRVIRAVEYYILHGTPISAHNKTERARPSGFSEAFFVLTDQREQLYARIDRRVDQMVAAGLYDEVKALRARGLTAQNTSMQGIGYKEMLACLDGQCTAEEAAELIKLHSRNYAKRQLTWFRREKNVIWTDISEFHYDKEEITQWIMKQCMKRWA